MFQWSSLFSRRSTPAPRNRSRLHIEQLEGRALPSGFGSLVPAGSVGQVVTDLGHISADMQSLTRAAGTSATTDVTKVQTDLTKLVADTLTGSTAAAATDFATLSGDEATLLKDVASTSTAGAAFRAVASLQKDVLALTANVAGLGLGPVGKLNHGFGPAEEFHEHSTGHEHEHGEGDDDDDGGAGLGQSAVIGDVLAVRSQLQSLVKSLGSRITPTVANDITVVRTALGSVVKDVLSGTSPTQDLTNLSNALTTLTGDVGKIAGTGGTVAGILKNLNTEITQLTSDVTTVANSAQTALNRVEADVAALESTLGTGLSSTAQTDVKALDAALTTLANDVKASTATVNDVTGVLTSELQLISDLAPPLSSGTQQSLSQLAADLLGLAPALSL